MKWILIAWLAVLLVSGCVSTGKKPYELENIVFVDTNVFDKDMSESMSVETETITVTTLAPIPINQIPTRLGKWLNVISDKGGHVEIDPKPTSKSAAWILGLLAIVWPVVKDEWLYGSAINYNAKIFYQPQSGMIKKVVFTKKELPKE